MQLLETVHCTATVPSDQMLEATAPTRNVDDPCGNPIGRRNRSKHFSSLHLRPIFAAIESDRGHETHMRGKASQGQAFSHVL